MAEEMTQISMKPEDHIEALDQQVCIAAMTKPAFWEPYRFLKQSDAPRIQLFCEHLHEQASEMEGCADNCLIAYNTIEYFAREGRRRQYPQDFSMLALGGQIRKALSRLVAHNFPDGRLAGESAAMERRLQQGIRCVEVRNDIQSQDMRDIIRGLTEPN